MPPNAAPKPKYWYRDFEYPEKRHWTSAPFGGWTEPMGLLKVPYAIFLRMHKTLLIPRYLVEKETRKELDQLNQQMKERQQKEKEEAKPDEQQ